MKFHPLNRAGLLAIFLLAGLLGCVKIQEKETKYPDGNRKEKYTYYLDEIEQEVLDGKFQSWYPSGAKKEEATYEEGVLTGQQITWFENGKQESLSSWLGGKKNGPFQTWYVSGQLKTALNWEMDLPVGEEKHYYPSGSLRSSTPYSEGKKQGAVDILDASGKTFATEYWHAGTLDSIHTYIPEDRIKVMTVKFGSNSPAEEFSYFLDPDGRQIKHGQHREWYKNGQLERQVGYDNGIKSGREIWYYDDGQEKMSTQWRMGEKEGEEVAWWAGKKEKKSVETFRNGVLDGPSTHWYKNGKKQSEVTYEKGGLTGEAKYWYENGNIKSHYHYVNDRLEGLIVKGYENGQKQSECVYKAGVKHGECREFHPGGELAEVAQYAQGVKDIASEKKYDAQGGEMPAEETLPSANEEAELREQLVKMARQCIDYKDRVPRMERDLKTNTLYKNLQKKEIELAREKEKQKKACDAYQSTRAQFLARHSAEDLKELAQKNQFVSLLSEASNF